MECVFKLPPTRSHRELSLGNGSGNYQSAACESPSLWRYGQLSKLQLIESATLKASLSHMFNWLQERSHIFAHNRLYLDTAIVIFTLSYLNAASWWVSGEEHGRVTLCWCGWTVRKHFFNLLFSLVFRVGRSRKQQAAQRGRDPVSTGENRENGWKCWGETPSCRHPDVWWEDRMGASSRCADKRSQLKSFSTVHERIKT